MSRRSEYLISPTDGLPSRVSGDWAADKLSYLDRYMAAFNRAMQGKFYRTFHDLLAGPGRCIDRTTHAEFDGSPLRAIHCPVPFNEIRLVEDDPTLAAALRQRVEGHAHVRVYEASCGDPTTIAQLRSGLDERTLSLAFVDNLGLTVPFDTLRALSDGLRMDLFVTFQTSDLTRNRSNAFGGPDGDRWTAYFGSTEWEEIVDRGWSRNAAAEDTAVDLMDHYEDRLRTLGYTDFARTRRSMRNSRNGELYRLLVASQSPVATKIFNSLLPPNRQRSMF